MRWSRSLVVLQAAAVLLSAGQAAAADEPGVMRLELEVGQDAIVSGGPIREFMCDDGSLVKVQFQAAGVALLGLQAGSTHCSFRDAASMRRVLRVIVRDPPPPVAPPAPKPPPAGGPPAPGGG